MIFVFIWHDWKETIGISFLNTCTLFFDYFLNNGIFRFLSSKMDIFSLVSEIGTTMDIISGKEDLLKATKNEIR